MAVLVIILDSYLMIVLNISIVPAALPKIHYALGFPPTGLFWVQNAYTLAFGGFLLLGARAGDILGRRRMFVVGIALFTAASLAVGLAQSAVWLVAARALQGLGAAILAPSTLARYLLAHRIATSLTAGSAMLALALVLVVALIVPARKASQVPVQPSSVADSAPLPIADALAEGTTRRITNHMTGITEETRR